jgi:hypothetical protein
MSFKQFLTEAAFNIQKFDKVLTLVEKVLEKRIGKIYRYNGDHGFIDLSYSGGVGFGFLYFYKDTSAFRINYVKDGSSFRFESVDIWNKFGLKNINRPIKPDYRVKIPIDTNIVQTLDALSDVLRKPDTGAKVFIAEQKYVPLYKQLLNEKKRTTFEEFCLFASKQHNLSSMSMADLKAVSDQYDVGIPGAVWQLKVGKDKFDLSKQVDDTAVVQADSSPSSPKVSAKSVTDILLITRGDDGKFYKMDTSTAPESVLKNVSSEINRVIKSDGAKELTPTHVLFQDLEDLVSIVATGQRPSLCVVGGPGIGKTHTVMDVIKGCGLKERSDFVVAKGKVTPAALYRTLFLNRDKLIIFDDTDSIWKDGDAVNILKAALDSYDVRKVTWFSAQTTNLSSFSKEEARNFINKVHAELSENPDAQVKLPAEFDFTGRVIFISNLPKNKLDSAVISRSLTIDMTLSEAQILERMEAILSKLGPSDQPIEDKIEAFNFFKDGVLSGNSTDFGEVTLRALIGVLGIRASGSPRWKSLCKYV